MTCQSQLYRASHTSVKSECCEAIALCHLPPITATAAPYVCVSAIPAPTHRRVCFWPLLPAYVRRHVRSCVLRSTRCTAILRGERGAPMRYEIPAESATQYEIPADSATGAAALAYLIFRQKRQPNIRFRQNRQPISSRHPRDTARSAQAKDGRSPLGAGSPAGWLRAEPPWAR